MFSPPRGERVGGVGLGQRATDRDLVRVLGHRGRRVAHRRAQRLDLEQQVGAAVLDRLEAADRPAELLAGLGVADGHVQRRCAPPSCSAAWATRREVQGAGEQPAAPSPASGAAGAVEVHVGELAGLVQRRAGRAGQARRAGGARRTATARPGRRDGQHQARVVAIEHQAAVAGQPPTRRPSQRAVNAGAAVPPQDRRRPRRTRAWRPTRPSRCRAGTGASRPRRGRHSSALAASTAAGEVRSTVEGPPISSSTIACSTKEKPAPPYSSGNREAGQPELGTGLLPHRAS